MKKAMVFGMVAALATGAAIAADDVVMVGQMGGSGSSEPEVSAEAALVTAHVWRGQVYNNDLVFQPQLTIAHAGVSFNIWGNYDLGKNYAGIDYDFSEIDLSLAYTLPVNLDDVTFDIGVISYNYPANGDRPAGQEGGINKKSTTELFGTATLLTFKDYVIPSVTLFGDIDEADGVYILFDIAAPYEVSDVLAVEGGISAGWGDTSYNDYYFNNAPVPGGQSTQDKGFNDFNLYGSASYEILENLTASASVTYTWLSGGSIRNAGDARYESDSKLWGGVNIAYDF